MLNNEKRKQRRVIGQMLRAWYGADFAEREIAAYPGDAETISSLVNEVLSEVFSGEELSLMELKEKWVDVAGIQIAGISRPVSIRNNVLYLEVDHNLWLRELMGPTKKLLIKNANSLCGDGFCNDIRCFSAGRHPAS